MGLAQSTEQQAEKCPLPGQPFIATTNNVSKEIESARQRINDLKELKKNNLNKIGNTIPVPIPLKNNSGNSGNIELKETSTTETSTPNGTSEITEEKVEETDGTKINLWRDNQKRVEEFKSMGGGFKSLKKMKLKNSELRELLKQNNLKISYKGKYLTKKQMLNKLKMLKF